MEIIEKAANLFLSRSELPPASQVVERLVAVEKANRKQKPQHSFEELLGNWQLRLITGTKKTREKAGVVLGAGRYVPKFLDIELIYHTQEKQEKSSSESLDSQLPNLGRVKNRVKLGFIELSLSGPIKFVPPKNILQFEFTTITVKLNKIKLYHGYIRNGRTKEKEFATQAIAQSPFFVYFLIRENFIAARGRGGGIALWSRKR
ncbi:hypothetical protein [Myxosarcina sp. GI1]|uniref:hypothetical protein n=1 Tax=Myxosarcina sp. GI1 TaxID=1541065 RepID=UPI00055FF3B7|nr:hypothetical protein [Myxosarcina sp. GI1]